MGEFADAAIWAGINGKDLSDMDADDWTDFHDENAPANPCFVYEEAKLFLGYLDDDFEYESPEKRVANLLVMFPGLDGERAADLVRGMEALTALSRPDNE